MIASAAQGSGAVPAAKADVIDHAVGTARPEAARQPLAIGPVQLPA
jgi:hypothetical protein